MRAGICKTVGEFQYSSLNVQPTDFEWDIVDFFAPHQPTIGLDKEWLDEPFRDEVEIAIRKGLRRREFHAPRTERGGILTVAELAYRKGTVTYAPMLGSGRADLPKGNCYP